jgi:hypothetical protein
VVGNNNYITSNRNSNCWYDGNIISAFSSLAAHYAHQTLLERFGDLSVVDIPQLLDITFPGYTINLGIDEWRLECGEFIQQVDAFNCRPIACMKILELYSLTTAYEVQLAHNTNTIYNLIRKEWQRFIDQCNNYLLLHVREHLPLLKPCQDGDTLYLPSNAPIIDAAVVAAAAASASAPEASMDIYSCCSNSPIMDLVRLKCCKNMIHQQCLIAYLGVNS